MSRIARVRARCVPLENVTLATSYGSGSTVRHHLFVAVETDDGARGVAEGSPLPHFSGERGQDMLRVVETAFAPALTGLDAFNLEAVHQALDRALAHNSASKAALVNAVFDLQGRLLGKPVTTLLGGRLRERVAVAGAVGIEETDRLLARARALFEAGVRTLKFKVGGDLRRDIEAIAAVRHEFGREVEIRADANGGYRLPEARRFLEGVRRLDLQYLEQPLPARDLPGLAALRRSALVPIAVDESLFSLADALQIVRQEAADVLVVKLIKLGGLHNARKVAALAEAAGLACVTVSPYETDLGGSANLHLSASSRAFTYAAELGTGATQVALADADRLNIEGGFAEVPASAGLGVGLPQGFFD